MKKIPRYIPSGLKRKDKTNIMCLNYKYCLAHPEEFNYFEQKCKEEKNKKLEFEIKEEQEKYNIDNIDNKHDKLFKDLFSKKDEVAKFLNKYLKLELTLKGDQLEVYKTEFVTSLYEKRETDIVYKLKDKNIFFLIEQQSTIDKSMPFRISDYSNLIMRQAVDKKRMKDVDYKYPKVISIVLYTGNVEWNANLKLEEIQEKLLGYNEIKEDYKIIDINKYSKEELLADDLLISRGMAIEKSKTNEEFIQNLAEIAKNIRDKQIPYGEYFLDIIQRYILKPNIREEAKEIIEKIKIKKGNNKDMLNIVRVQLEAYEACRQEGIQEGKKDKQSRVAKKLYEMNMPIEQIAKALELEVEEVKEILNI